MRKNFVQALHHAEVPAHDAALLAGHELGKSFTYAHYSPLGQPLKQRAAIIEKVRYDGLKLDRLKG